METLGRHKSKQAPILNLVEVTASSILEVVILASVGYLLARRGVIDKKTQTVSAHTEAAVEDGNGGDYDPQNETESIGRNIARDG